jgi:hypothetical protein
MLTDSVPGVQANSGVFADSWRFFGDRMPAAPFMTMLGLFSSGSGS